MAKGITQAQVDTAADALVIAGERPTVDRIRAFLGTGSPNTVTRMLETWWQSLGAKALQTQLTKREQEWRQNERQLGEARELAMREATAHQQDATVQRARSDALEQQLLRLEETALRIASTQSPSTSRRKRVTRSKGAQRGDAR